MFSEVFLYFSEFAKLQFMFSTFFFVQREKISYTTTPLCVFLKIYVSPCYETGKIIPCCNANAIDFLQIS